MSRGQIYCRTVISFNLAVKNSIWVKDINLVSFTNEVNSLAPSLCLLGHTESMAVLIPTPASSTNPGMDSSVAW